MGNGTSTPVHTRPNWAHPWSLTCSPPENFEFAFQVLQLVLWLPVNHEKPNATGKLLLHSLASVVSMSPSGEFHWPKLGRPLNWTNLEVTRSPSTTPILSVFSARQLEKTFPLFQYPSIWATCMEAVWHAIRTAGTCCEKHPLKVLLLQEKTLFVFFWWGHAYMPNHAQSTYWFGIVVSTCCLQTMFGHFRYPLTNPHLLVCLVFWRDETCVYNQWMSS